MADKDATDLIITYEEHKAFLEEPTCEGKIKILIKHSKKNNLRIERSKTMEQEKSQEQTEKEMNELGEQFSEFLHTKGIIAKFRLAFANMGESAEAQHGQDKIHFEEEKAMSKERHRQAVAGNADFIEFIHTKGFKAKCRLIVENMKKSAAESKQKTAEQIAEQKAQTAEITAAGTHPYVKTTDEISTEELTREFNVFLKEKGLSDEYVVTVDSNNDKI